MHSTIDDPTKLLILGDQHQIETIIPQVPNDWNILVANSVDEALAKLDSTCAVLLIIDSIIEENPEKFLLPINEKIESTQLVLFQLSSSTINILSLFNRKLIDYLITDVSEEMDILKNAVNDYYENIDEVKQENKIKARLEAVNNSIISEDNLLNLSLELSDSKEIKDFSNQFLAMIEGLHSFISVNFAIYKDSDDKSYQDIIFKYIADVELLANQYDQKILMIYIENLRAYLYLLFNDVHQAMHHYQNCIRIFYWISDEYLDKTFVDIIMSFPVQKDDYYYIKTGEKEFELDLNTKLNIRNNINNLLNYDISKLINLTEQFYQSLHIEPNLIQTIMVVRDSLPVYIYDEKMDNMDPVLVTGFVEALSSFLQELTSGAGDIDQIKHDVGIILIHREGDLRYLLVASRDELYLRMGLRQFAKNTYDEIRQIPQNDEASDEQYEKFSKKIKELFYINE